MGALSCLRSQARKRRLCQLFRLFNVVCAACARKLTFPGRLLLLLEKGANLTSTFNSALPLYCLPFT